MAEKETKSKTIQYRVYPSWRDRIKKRLDAELERFYKKNPEALDSRLKK